MRVGKKRPIDPAIVIAMLEIHAEDLFDPDKSPKERMERLEKIVRNVWIAAMMMNTTQRSSNEDNVRIKTDIIELNEKVSTLEKGIEALKAPQGPAA